MIPTLPPNNDLPPSFLYAYSQAAALLTTQPVISYYVLYSAVKLLLPTISGKPMQERFAGVLIDYLQSQKPHLPLLGPEPDARAVETFAMNVYASVALPDKKGIRPTRESAALYRQAALLFEVLGQMTGAGHIAELYLDKITMCKARAIDIMSALAKNELPPPFPQRILASETDVAALVADLPSPPRGCPATPSTAPTPATAPATAAAGAGAGAGASEEDEFLAALPSVPAPAPVAGAAAAGEDEEDGFLDLPAVPGGLRAVRGAADDPVFRLEMALQAAKKKEWAQALVFAKMALGPLENAAARNEK